MRSSKTPLLQFVRQAFRLAVTANQPHSAPADELIDQWHEHLVNRRREANLRSRRDFLRTSGQLAMLTGGLGLINACSPETDIQPGQPGTRGRGARLLNQPRLAIIGAGIAGLNAAHTLSKSGFDNFTIYEGATRTGGRMFSVNGLMGPGLTTELGGEFIDSTHEDMLNLVTEFGLTLLDTQAPSELALIKDAYFFNGRHYTLAEVVAAFQAIAPQIQQDIDSLPDDISYGSTDPTAVRLDRTSISAYLSSIGATGWLKELLEVAYETEFGRSCNDQSSLNFLTLISTDTSGGKFDIFGESDERYKIAGGNQQVTNRLTELYQSHIQTGRVLRAINQRGSQIELVFDGGSPVRADLVLITVPFSVLRQMDINVKMPAVKRQAIQQLGYGTNAKLLLGFQSRPWRTLGYTGYVFSDNGLQSGWDNTQLQSGTRGGFTVYTGGLTGVNLGNGSLDYQASRYLPKLNQIFPGSAAQYNGIVQRMHWPTYPFVKASYACYRVGQWTSIGGAEGEPLEQLFFAGEHCSGDYQGYMNGGAETGRVAAEQILERVMV
ncbi:hypothetical protein BN8_04244 [Fibrisoma limi BUZ 3]|uniref:Amine oxidase domain-containing protein n=1 Tax=Fibrisoma limi BUZ 3 TaxID=1185876 RepID=I2GM88_9BACT|nr:NAD(P)/FAD-dependent oxidoreductase [Fibrisoma limi]CCH55015.1 hypothetical protein BN8_04244 [Fibrisoma limi BUZ 3]